MKIEGLNINSVLCVIAFTAALTSLAMARNQAEHPEPMPMMDDTALARLILDRQTELDIRLQALNDAIADLGDKHPSVESMRRESEQLERQIDFWSSPTEKLLDIDDRELRVLVMQLVIQVDKIESRSRDTRAQVMHQNRSPISTGRSSRPRR